MKYNFIELGKILYNKRTEEGLSLRCLAHDVGVSYTEIYNIENGFRIKPNMVTIINICEALGLNPLRVLYVTNFFSEEMVEDFIGKADNPIKKVGEKRYKIEAKTIDEMIDILDKFFAENLVSDNKNEPKNECKSCEYYCPYCGECTYDE